MKLARACVRNAAISGRFLIALLSGMKHGVQSLPHGWGEAPGIDTPNMAAMSASDSQHSVAADVDLCAIMSARWAAKRKM
jgi:hypothetical protein